MVDTGPYLIYLFSNSLIYKHKLCIIMFSTAIYEVKFQLTKIRKRQ